MRCFKCHAYGHIAKNCESPDQLCETCGSKDHLKTTCKQGDAPSCINCIRNKRKDSKHSVRSEMCPEFRRQVEIYRQNKMGLKLAQINAQRSSAASAELELIMREQNIDILCV